MAVVIDGKTQAALLRGQVKEKIAAESVAAGKRPPSLSVILVGENPASLVYIRNKQTACQETGIAFHLHALPENTSQTELLALIDTLNADPGVDGILPQQPFPPHIDKYAAVSRVDPAKDVDCLHPYNIGLYMAGRGALLPCTPAGVVRLLMSAGVKPAGKHCVILGRSDVVGKPLSMMMLALDATVTICHSRTQELADITRRADILVAAIGKPRFVTADMIKPGCAVIDVGVNRLGGKRICGDTDYEACFEKVACITPVPGGVGPMTVAVLMENCLKAWESR